MKRTISKLWLLAAMLTMVVVLVHPREVQAQGPTTCGTLQQNEIWPGNGSVHIVTCDVTVPSGITLTIGAGAIIKFEVEDSLIVRGTLRALGTDGNPVYFTSIRDDRGGW